MSDFVLQMTILPDQLPQFDLATSAAEMTDENSLQTAVLMSLFTDRLAAEDDVIPDATGDRRGWWADVLTGQSQDNIGSRLWLLEREKQMTSVLRRAEEYTHEALAWMLEDGLASAVRVTATNPRRGWLNLHIEIDRPNDGAAQFDFIWEALNAV